MAYKDDVLRQLGYVETNHLRIPWPGPGYPPGVRVKPPPRSVERRSAPKRPVSRPDPSDLFEGTVVTEPILVRDCEVLAYPGWYCAKREARCEVFSPSTEYRIWNEGGTARRSSGWPCERLEGHSGPHVVFDGEEGRGFYLLWPQEDEGTQDAQWLGLKPGEMRRWDHKHTDWPVPEKEAFPPDEKSGCGDRSPDGNGACRLLPGHQGPHLHMVYCIWATTFLGPKDYVRRVWRDEEDDAKWMGLEPGECYCDVCYADLVSLGISGTGWKDGGHECHEMSPCRNHACLRTKGHVGPHSYGSIALLGVWRREEE